MYSVKSLISIIIPIYNSYDLIDNCLESLDKQTSNNFEVIFVDDNSSDCSLNKMKSKIDKFSFNYKLIKNKNNMGPGFTRNRGIKESTTNYITFIDSDDYVSENFIESLEKIILEAKPDVVLFDYYMVKNKNKIRKNAIVSDEAILNKDFALAMCNGMCWGKLYKKEIIIKNNVEFPNIMRSEDLAFVKVYVDKCKKVYYLNEPLYYYINNAKSIMHNSNTLNINNNIMAFNYINDNIKSNDSLKMIFLREYLYLIVQIMILKKYKTKDIKQFIKEAEQKQSDCYNNMYLKFQPLYFRIILKCIQYRLIFFLKIIFSLKRG